MPGLVAVSAGAMAKPGLVALVAGAKYGDSRLSSSGWEAKIIFLSLQRPFV